MSTPELLVKTRYRNLHDHRKRAIREDPWNLIREAVGFYTEKGWRGYNGYIGQPLFYEGQTEKMRSAVLSSDLLQSKIRELASRKLGMEKLEGCAERYQELQDQMQHVAVKLVDEMIATPEYHSFIKFAGFAVGNGLASMYNQGMHVKEEEVEMLKSYARMAEKAGQSLILLPPHRSHVDYVSIQLCFYRLGLSLPMVVAGNNLNIPGLGPFLRNCGAFYIRRRWGDDELYAVVVQAYIDQILAHGYNLECFIEGTRSRTGKLLQPKLGMLRLILSAIQRGVTSDCWIVPTSIQYDRVIETEAYVNELLGKPKESESLLGLLSSGSGLLQLKMGRIDVRFAKPWSLRQFISSIQRNDTMLLRTIAYQVLADINQISVTMPTTLVGTVLLTLRGRGVGQSELNRRVAWLAHKIRQNGGNVAEFEPMRLEDVVDRAVHVLDNLIGEEKGLIERTFYAKDRFQLSFLRNACIHYFVSEAIIAASLYTQIKQGGGPRNQRLSFTELRELARFLSVLLKTEFIYPHGSSSFDSNLKTTLQRMVKDNVLSWNEETGVVELSVAERQCGRENYDFYCFLLWPFIDTNWLACASLFILVSASGHWADKRQFYSLAQLFGKTLYNQGDLSYLEAVNKETLGNALQRLEEDGVIIANDSKDSSGQIRLNPAWVPSGKFNEGRLWKLLEKISIFRREGKNRRDNETVSVRVLSLAKRCGESLRVDSKL